MTFKQKPVAVAINAATAPVDPPACNDCKFFRWYDAHTNTFYQPDDESRPEVALPACVDEDTGRALDARAVRDDEEGCGEDGEWFTPRVAVVVQ